MQILITFITKIALLLLIFLFAFIILFHLLLPNHIIFTDAWSWAAVFKSLQMGVSGVGFPDYYEGLDHHTDLVYPVGAALCFIAFIIFVQVLFMNLATGLAIEDVEKIRKHSQGEMNAIKINVIYHAERHIRLTEWFLKKCCFCCKIRLLGSQRRFYNLPANKAWKIRLQES